MSEWRVFSSIFPPDTRQLLSILMPGLLIDTDLLRQQIQPDVSGRTMLVNGRPVHLPPKKSRRGDTYVDVQTISIGPGQYHLRVRVGSDWSPVMAPEALKLYLIVQYPALFVGAS